MSIGKRVGLLIFAVLLIDQGSKFWIKMNMKLYESIHVFDWFQIYFTENPGMAFGMEFGGVAGKLLLTGFRIVAIVFIGIYIRKLIKMGATKGLILTLALVLAGAAGNVIDSAFYGVIFNDSYGQVATLFPPEGGYAPYLQGKVVDMLYFPLFEGTLPDFLPWVGGKNFIFFSPIFNVADSAITISVFIFLIFNKRFVYSEGDELKVKLQNPIVPKNTEAEA